MVGCPAHAVTSSRDVSSSVLFTLPPPSPASTSLRSGKGDFCAAEEYPPTSDDRKEHQLHTIRPTAAVLATTSHARQERRIRVSLYPGARWLLQRSPNPQSKDAKGARSPSKCTRCPERLATNRKSVKSKPGPTLQPTREKSPRLRAACQTP